MKKNIFGHALSFQLQPVRPLCIQQDFTVPLILILAQDEEFGILRSQTGRSIEISIDRLR